MKGTGKTVTVAAIVAVVTVIVLSKSNIGAKL